jgi:hypothetical protein
MTPTQFLARLCALIPPPRHPLVRFHGVFAPHSSWRSQVVALAPASAARLGGPTPSTTCAEPEPEPRPQPNRQTAGLVVPTQSSAAVAPLSPAAPRIDRATLLKRIYDVDALACPCGGRLRFIALIIEPETAAAILDSLELPSAPPPIARARSPNTDDLLDPCVFS